jgi:hypothetical protein
VPGSECLVQSAPTVSSRIWSFHASRRDPPKRFDFPPSPTLSAGAFAGPFSFDRRFIAKLCSGLTARLAGCASALVIGISSKCSRDLLQAPHSRYTRGLRPTAVAIAPCRFCSWSFARRRASDAARASHASCSCHLVFISPLSVLQTDCECARGRDGAGERSLSGTLASAPCQPESSRRARCTPRSDQCGGKADSAIRHPQRVKYGNIQKNTIVRLSRTPNRKSSKCHVSNGFGGRPIGWPSLSIGCSL